MSLVWEGFLEHSAGTFLRYDNDDLERSQDVGRAWNNQCLWFKLHRDTNEKGDSPFTGVTVSVLGRDWDVSNGTPTLTECQAWQMDQRASYCR